MLHNSTPKENANRNSIAANSKTLKFAAVY
jgi:hypothetical protein